MIHSLTTKKSVSFLGINIIYLPDRRIYVSHPGELLIWYELLIKTLLNNPTPATGNESRSGQNLV
jgi:hypothetical protein